MWNRWSRREDCSALATATWGECPSRGQSGTAGELRVHRRLHAGGNQVSVGGWDLSGPTESSRRPLPASTPTSKPPSPSCAAPGLGAVPLRPRPRRTQPPRHGGGVRSRRGRDGRPASAAPGTVWLGCEFDLANIDVLDIALHTGYFPKGSMGSISPSVNGERSNSSAGRRKGERPQEVVRPALHVHPRNG
jgi:hypothetical protein